MADSGNTGGFEPSTPEDDLGDPTEDPDGDDENVSTSHNPEDPQSFNPGIERRVAGATPAPACLAALREATQRWPSRNRASDGIMCDAAHPPSSDHCRGNAFDLTNDPARGCDAHALGEQLKQRCDRRVKYIISNRRIWNPTISPHWRPYSGENPHTRHVHVSILATARGNTSPWWGGPILDDWRTHPVIRRGARDYWVRHMQELLIRAGHDLSQEGGADGQFGPGTERELRAYQAHRGLAADGICGPRTWERLHQ